MPETTVFCICDVETHRQTVLRDVGIIQLIINILQIPLDSQNAALVSFNTKRTLRPPLRATSSSSDGEEAVSFDDIATGRESRIQHILFLSAEPATCVRAARQVVGPVHFTPRVRGGARAHAGAAAGWELQDHGDGGGQVIGRLVAFLQEHIGPVMATHKDEPPTAKRVDDDDEVAAVVDVLSALCYVTGAGPITGNQDYIAGQLLRDGEDIDILVHTRVAWEKHSVTGGDANGDAGRVVSAGHNVAQLKMRRGGMAFAGE
ncbi:hypothetical protein BC938DRAFT_478126, partial [Jimgerdemannia flammicorona]